MKGNQNENNIQTNVNNNKNNEKNQEDNNNNNLNQQPGNSSTPKSQSNENVDNISLNQSKHLPYSTEQYIIKYQPRKKSSFSSKGILKANNEGGGKIMNMPKNSIRSHRQHSLSNIKGNKGNSSQLAKIPFNKEENEIPKYVATENSLNQINVKNSKSLSQTSALNCTTHKKLSDEYHESKSIEDLQPKIRKFLNYYNFSANNDLNDLGLQKISLTSQYIQDYEIDPIERFFIMHSQSDQMLGDEQIRLLQHKSQIQMQQQMQINRNYINSYGVLAILSEMLTRKEIAFIIDNKSIEGRREQIIHNEEEACFYQIFSMYNLHLLASNLSTQCLLIRFKCEREHDGSTLVKIVKDKTKQDALCNFLIKEIYKIMCSELNKSLAEIEQGHKIYKIRFIADEKSSTFTLKLFISNIQAEWEQSLFLKIQQKLVKQIHNILSVQQEQIIKLCRLYIELLDPYFNYRERDFEFEESISQSSRSASFFKPRGWMHYIFFRNPEYLQRSQQELDEINKNWGVGYCDMDSVNWNGSSTGNSQIEEIIMNKNAYMTQDMENGFIIQKKVDNCINNRTISMTFQGQLLKFFVKLRVRFDITRAHFQKIGNEQVYIMHDPEYIITEGLLIKCDKDTLNSFNGIKKSIILI